MSSKSTTTSELFPKDPKSYYRHRVNGQRGFLVEESGKRFIRLDRPQEVMLRPYDEVDWIPDVEQKPLTKVAVAQIAQAADQQLCKAIGKIKESRVDWNHIKPDTKAKWIEDTIVLDDPIRQLLKRRIHGLLGKYAR